MFVLSWLRSGGEIDGGKITGIRTVSGFHRMVIGGGRDQNWYGRWIIMGGVVKINRSRGQGGCQAVQSHCSSRRPSVDYCQGYAGHHHPPARK